MKPESFTVVLSEFATGSLVMGAPLTVHNTTLVPVISVSAGYGSMAGGSSGGGGFSLTPVALVAFGDSGIQVYTLQGQVEPGPMSAVISDIINRHDRGTTDACGH